MNFRATIEKRQPSFINKTVKRLDDEEDEDVMQEGIFLVPYKKQIRKTQYTFNLDENIGAPVKYRNLINCLVEAEEGDCVRLIINTSGGRLDSTMSIIQNLRETAAETVAIVSGEAYSAGSAIVLACEQVAVLPGSSFLVHSASFGYGGKAKDVSDFVRFSEKQIRSFVETSYKGFLSPEEIQNVLDGKEMWMDDVEIIERLHKRKALQEKQMESEMKSLKKQQKAIQAEMSAREVLEMPVEASKKPSKARKAVKATKDASSVEGASEALV